MSGNEGVRFAGGTLSAPARVIGCRWGGGARPGLWYVCLIAEGYLDVFGALGVNCTVDDFGNLVRVP